MEKEEELVDLPNNRPGIMLYLDFNETIKEISHPSLTILSIIMTYIRDETNIIAFSNGKPMGIKEIGSVCNKSKNTVIKVIKELEEKQIICRIKDKSRMTLYANPYMMAKSKYIRESTLYLFKDYVLKESICFKKTFIYFILNKELNSIKIGYTADIIKRFDNLQTGNSSTLILLGKIMGGFKLETHIHKILKEFRIRGEWYKYNKEVEEYVNKLLERKV